MHNVCHNLPDKISNDILAQILEIGILIFILHLGKTRAQKKLTSLNLVK